MKLYGVIYLIKNKKNGMIYVGQTIQKVQKRWKAHRTVKNNSRISKALRNKLDNFEFIEFLSCYSKDDLNFWEKELIKQFNSLSPNGYNLMTGGNEYDFDDSVKEKMSKAKLGKESENHIISVKAKNIKTNQIKFYNSMKDACTDLKISRSSILKSCKYNLVRKDYQFSYANQSGSSETKESEYAQRLEGEPVLTEYNPSTSPRFPQKYMDQKDLILQLNQELTPHAISRKLKLDKSMLCYFIHCFGK